VTDVLVGFFEALTDDLVSQFGEDLNFEGLAVETFEDLQDHFLRSGNLLGRRHVLVIGKFVIVRIGKLNLINQVGLSDVQGINFFNKHSMSFSDRLRVSLSNWLGMGLFDVLKNVLRDCIKVFFRLRLNLIKGREPFKVNGL